MQRKTSLLATALGTAALALAVNVPARAQSAGSSMTVIGYAGSQAPIQDPPGSNWKIVPVSSLPASAAVLQYLPDQWVEIINNGHAIRIALTAVKTSGLPPPPDVQPCAQGTTAAATAGEQGLGGC